MSKNSQQMLNKLMINSSKYGIKYFFWKVLENFGLSKSMKSSLYKRNYYLSLSIQERESELKEWFKASAGYPLNLDNPQTFNEKIQWMKLYDSTQIKTRLADKYEVRAWVEEQIGKQYLIPLIGVWNSFDQIDFSRFPSKFVLKSNYGSGMNIIVQDRDSFDRKTAKTKFDMWMKTEGINEQQEWQYLKIPHKIIAEKYMADQNGELPDYKVYCFNGEPKYIHVIDGRFTSETKQAFLNTEWEIMPFYHERYKVMTSAPRKPEQLDRMLQLSKILSECFAFVRVDWYLLGSEDILFGEMTFTPASGVRRWIPEGTDEMLGNMINLPSEKYIVTENRGGVFKTSS